VGTDRNVIEAQSSQGFIVVYRYDANDEIMKPMHLLLSPLYLTRKNLRRFIINVYERLLLFLSLFDIPYPSKRKVRCATTFFFISYSGESPEKSHNLRT